MFEESPESLWYRLVTQLGTTGRQRDLREVRPSRRSPKRLGASGLSFCSFSWLLEVESLFCCPFLGLPQAHSSRTTQARAPARLFFL